jgi:hypothetical protein
MNQTSPDPIDRRSSTRRACRLVVRYRTDGSWRPATAVDLSERGCRLRIGEDLPRGAVVRVAFARPEAEGQAPAEVQGTGAVIWCRLEGLSHQAGVHFTEPPPDVEELLAPLA